MGKIEFNSRPLVIAMINTQKSEEPVYMKTNNFIMYKYLYKMPKVKGGLDKYDNRHNQMPQYQRWRT